MNIFENKNIILVGNAPGLSITEIVDQNSFFSPSDFFVTFNRLSPLNQASVWGCGQILPDDYFSQEFILYDKNTNPTPPNCKNSFGYDAEMYQGENPDPAQQWITDLIHEIDNTIPLSGLIAIKFFLMQPIKSLYIFNFDFYLRQDKNEEYYLPFNDDSHRLWPQREWLKKIKLRQRDNIWHPPHKIFFDDILHEVLDNNYPQEKIEYSFKAILGVVQIIMKPLGVADEL